MFIVLNALLFILNQKSDFSLFFILFHSVCYRRNGTELKYRQTRNIKIIAQIDQ